MGGSSSGGVSSYIVILFVRFLQQEYRSGLPFPPPVDYFCQIFFHYDLSIWVTLHGLAHSFIELHKPLGHEKAMIREKNT